MCADGNSFVYRFTSLLVLKVFSACLWFADKLSLTDHEAESNRSNLIFCAFRIAF